MKNMLISILTVLTMVSCQSNTNSESDAEAEIPEYTKPRNDQSSPEGKQVISKDDMIKVEKPNADEEISSPYTIKGEARGHWFFEGDFPVELLNEDSTIIAEGIATADGQWMTEEYVPFEAEINFDETASNRGYVVLRRSNPSGKPENDSALFIPVQLTTD